ncbi:branched-chain amino acid transport system II carrier protein [Niallia taxi]|uniref:branched-chain amino acid transport system II carrier protein n=1 Tax=Niallia taxi TaxID=2499688 RepID=UPI003AB41467
MPFSFILILGFMLFALFFGAGNLIFPPMLGQMAGTNVWEANTGFLTTGVGLPLLAIIAFVFSGEKDLLSLSSRVHPIFGVIFTTLLYLAIGPFFAIPRAGNVSYEIGLSPLLKNQSGHLPLFIFTIVFFAITCLLSLNPTKIIDIVGRFLTPIKLTFIGILVGVAVINPIGEFQKPFTGYTSGVYFIGFQEGYLTLDALVAFVFGIVIVKAIKDHGAYSKKVIMVTCIKAACIAAAILVTFYTALSYMGASSVEEIGLLDNGAEVLAAVSNYYFGSYGAILLGLMITVACLTTSVGLITACSSFFHELVPKVSYKKFAVILSVFSALVANMGLTYLIKISVPVLMAMYPIAIALIFLTFLHSKFKGKKEVYQGSILLTFIISLNDGLKEAGIKLEAIDTFFSNILPMYNIGLGWFIPSIIGGLCGLLINIIAGKVKDSKTPYIGSNK